MMAGVGRHGTNNGQLFGHLVNGNSTIGRIFRHFQALVAFSGTSAGATAGPTGGNVITAIHRASGTLQQSGRRKLLEFAAR